MITIRLSKVDPSERTAKHVLEGNLKKYILSRLCCQDLIKEFNGHRVYCERLEEGFRVGLSSRDIRYL